MDVFIKIPVAVYVGPLIFQTLLPGTFGPSSTTFWVGSITNTILTGTFATLEMSYYFSFWLG